MQLQGLMMFPLTTSCIKGQIEEIAFTADLEAMFHQVKVLPKDADALRFLWWSGSLNDPPDEYQMLVHIFGATSSPCCANKAVHQTADDNEDQFDPEVTRTVCRNVSTSLAPRRHLAAQTRQCIKPQMTMRANLTQR